MDTEVTFVDDGGKWKVSENIIESIPNVFTVMADNVVVEAVVAIDGGDFVVPSEQEDARWVFDCQREKESDDFDLITSTVDVIAEKQEPRKGISNHVPNTNEIV